MEDSIADGICDDANNNVECYFDGGDCCFNIISFCDECICYYGKRKVAKYSALLLLQIVTQELSLGDMTISSYFDYWNYS